MQEKFILRYGMNASAAAFVITRRSKKFSERLPKQYIFIWVRLLRSCTLGRNHEAANIKCKNMTFIFPGATSKLRETRTLKRCALHFFLINSK